MVFLLSGLFSLASLVTLGWLISKAPEAYETEGGLRIVHPTKRGEHRQSTRFPIAPVLP
jgi:hypothetical protein